jgi:hypothetical protein
VGISYRGATSGDNLFHDTLSKRLCRTANAIDPPSIVVHHHATTALRQEKRIGSAKT